MTVRTSGSLLETSWAGRDRQHHAIEEVPAGNPVHERTFLQTLSMPRRVGRPAQETSPPVTHRRVRENN